MHLVVEELGDVGVVRMQLEELDASNVGEFRREMAPLLDSHTKLTLDLAKLRFVDSSGLGAFLSCLRKLTANGGDLTLFGMSKSVRSVFELVRMHRVFCICDTQAEAVRAFAE